VGGAVVDRCRPVLTFAFFTPKHLGEGQFYLMTVKDKNGQSFDGSKNYRLTVPANAPVRQPLFDKMWKLPDIEQITAQ
jgi:hypothetical protein